MIKLVINIYMSNKFLPYKDDPTILEKIPDFKLNMTYGLNCNLLN